MCTQFWHEIWFMGTTGHTRDRALWFGEGGDVWLFFKKEESLFSLAYILSDASCLSYAMRKEGRKEDQKLFL